MQYTSTLLLLIACGWMLHQVAAHGYLAVPVSRNLYARQQGTFYDEMSGNGLGQGGTSGGPGELSMSTSSPARMCSTHAAVAHELAASVGTTSLAVVLL